MTIPTKKLSNGFEMSVFGLGTWMFGGAKTRDPENDDAGQVQAIMNALDSGVFRIDTAENYSEGQSETLVGLAINSYAREQLFYYY